MRSSDTPMHSPGHAQVYAGQEWKEIKHANNLANVPHIIADADSGAFCDKHRLQLAKRRVCFLCHRAMQPTHNTML